MKDNFETSLLFVLAHEGGFADHPLDTGGATMKGVTLMTFRRYFGAGKTVQELKDISHAQLERIYRIGYWNPCGGDSLPLGLDYAVFDFGVNSGPGRAVKTLQQAAGATVDGGFGHGTMAKVEAASAIDLINKVCDSRLAFLKGLNTFSAFGRGWAARVNSVRTHALAMHAETVAGARVPAGDNMLTTLEAGANGPLVEKLQAALGIEVDGDFGPGTESAVKVFQQEHRLVVDGIVGRSTWRALGLMP